MSFTETCTFIPESIAKKLDFIFWLLIAFVIPGIYFYAQKYHRRKGKEWERIHSGSIFQWSVHCWPCCMKEPKSKVQVPTLQQPVTCHILSLGDKLRHLFNNSHTGLPTSPFPTFPFYPVWHNGSKLGWEPDPLLPIWPMSFLGKITETHSDSVSLSVKGGQ